MQPECTRRAMSYWTLCRCEDCIADRARKRKLIYVYGNQRVPNDVAWKRLAACFDAGWTPRAVGSAVGVEPEYFRHHYTNYKRGRKPILGPTISAKIMRMGRPTEGQVGAEPTRRRLRALACLGWGLNQLARETGVNFSTLAMARSGNERVSARLAALVAEHYERLAMEPGPSRQASREAVEKGWLPPLAWDDIESGVRPVEAPVVRRAVGRPVAPRDRVVEDVEWLADADESLTAVCDRLSILPETLYQTCRRAGRLDLYAKLSRRDPNGDVANTMRRSKRGAA